MHAIHNRIIFNLRIFKINRSVILFLVIYLKDTQRVVLLSGCSKSNCDHRKFVSKMLLEHRKALHVTQKREDPLLWGLKQLVIVFLRSRRTKLVLQKWWPVFLIIERHKDLVRAYMRIQTCCISRGIHPCIRPEETCSDFGSTWCLRLRMPLQMKNERTQRSKKRETERLPRMKPRKKTRPSRERQASYRSMAR